MKKVAIVGVEGSGKTVMLAGLGELYSRPDKDGYFLSPKNFSTASYVAEIVGRIRNGKWPAATAEDVMQGLDWTLKRRSGEGVPESICEVSFLDFAGEVYRSAFGVKGVVDNPSNEVNALWNYVKNADSVIVLVNLKDVIAYGPYNPRVHESIWITRRILDYALDTSNGRQTPSVAIALSQTDSYADTINECGGGQGVLEKYMPYVAADYGWLDVVMVCAVDKTRVDDDGNVVPDVDFTFEGLRSIMNRVVSDKIDGQYSEYQLARVLGTLILIGAGVGMACFGFLSWLNIYDLNSLTSTATSEVRTIASGLTFNLIWCGVLSILAFMGFLLSVCVKPGAKSKSVWINRFVLGLFAFGLSISAGMFGEFAVAFNGKTARTSLEEKYAPCQGDNVTGCVITSLGVIIFGATLAFGCDSGKRRIA